MERERYTEMEAPPRAVQATKALAWFSVGLGAAELALPGAVARLIGVDAGRRNRWALRLLGAREVAAGLGIFGRPWSQPRRSAPVWARALGDMVDLAWLGWAFRGRRDHERRARRKNDRRVAGAVGAVLGVAALDVYAALATWRRGEGAASSSEPVRGAITIHRAPLEVYTYFRDFDRLPRLLAHVEAVEARGEGRWRWRLARPAVLGKESEPGPWWEMELFEARPGERLAWQSPSGAERSQCGAVSFRPTLDGRGTEVRVELQFQPRFVGGGSKLVAKGLRELLLGDLRRMKQVIETGAVMRSDASIHRSRHPAQPPAATVEEIERAEAHEYLGGLLP